MVIFNSYVKLPEGNQRQLSWFILGFHLNQQLGHGDVLLLSGPWQIEAGAFKQVVYNPYTLW